GALGHLRRAARRAAFAALAALLALAPAAAGDPPARGWEPGRVHVGRVDYAGAIEIERDGKSAVLWLSGVDAVSRHDGPLATRAVEAVVEWLAVGEPSLLSPEPRERGGLAGVLRLGDGTLLNEKLISNGYALLDPETAGESYERQLRTAQQFAYRNRRGLWGEQIKFADSLPPVRNQFATVCGELGPIRVQGKGGRDHYHLGGDYPRHFLTIEVRPELRAATAPVLRTGKQICVVGRLETRDIVPAVVVNDATQVRERAAKK
ncbi:MAG: hypothetical protein DCC71_03480, partial [Proteobacteria bacterium]